MPLYATAPAPVPGQGETRCTCAACRFGHGGDRAVRARRYASDMTDAEGRAVAPLLPWPDWLTGYGGRPEEYRRRLVIDALCYVADNGQCRCLSY